MAINIYIASKNVGWDKPPKSIPTFAECVLISAGVLRGSQEAYERLLTIRRFVPTGDWDDMYPGEDLLDEAYKFVQNQKH